MRHLVTIILVFMVLGLCSQVFATDLPESNRAYPPWSGCDDDRQVKLYCVNHYLFAIAGTSLIQVWDYDNVTKKVIPAKCIIQRYVQEE